MKYPIYREFRSAEDGARFGSDVTPALMLEEIVREMAYGSRVESVAHPETSQGDSYSTVITTPDGDTITFGITFDN